MNKLITQEQIQQRLKEIAEDINKSYDEITLLIVLTGGVYTAIDLSKYITIPCRLEFVKISSYGHNENCGVIDLKWISVKRGQHLGNLLIVDDVFDTGNTYDYLLKYCFNNFTFDEIGGIMLLDKPYRREKDAHIKYVGFKINDEFVYGYGLDLKDYERNLTDIYFVEE